MTDISRESVEGRPSVLDGVVNRALIEGLVAALDAAEAERDKLRAEIAEAREALQPFAFLARVNEKLNLDPELPLKDFVPGVWPKWKDVKRALAALREAGHE